MQPGKEMSVELGAVFDSVSRLKLDEKRHLWQALEEEIGQAEEQLWERDPKIRSEVRGARAAYEAGDFVTLEDYLAGQDRS